MLPDITLGQATVTLVIEGGTPKLVLTEKIGPIAGPMIKLDLAPADLVGALEHGFTHFFAKKP